MDDKKQKYAIVKPKYSVSKPMVSLVISVDLHDALKVYAYSKQMRMREATEHLIKLALWQEMHKEEDKP